MKYAHNVKLSVFSHEDEDSAKIEQALRNLVPFDLEDKRISVNKTIATGAKDNKIFIFEIFLEKQSHVSKFISNLLSNLSEDQKDLLMRQSGSRLDSELNFFIRLNKTILLDQDLWQITESGNCFHIRITIAAYPAKRDAGLVVVNKMLSSSTD